MTPSGLHRQLLFYGYDEVTDFLKNSPLNRHIYKKYLDLLPDGTTWICGHIHDQKICDWVNSSGAHIRILCNPSGYPGEGRSEADTVKVVNGKIERDIVTTTHEDFIIDI